MGHTRDYDETLPLDTDKEGLGASEIRDFKNDILERIGLDHYMKSNIDTGVPTADGYHKQVTLANQVSDPSVKSNAVIIYSKDVSGKSEVFALDSSGNIIQITHEGSLAFGKSAYSGFRATMSGNQSISSDALLNMTVEGFDIGSNYNTIDKKFVVPFDGIYYIQYYLNASGVSGLVKKNSVDLVSLGSYGSITYNLVSGDIIELFGSGSGTVYSTNSHWSIVRLK